MKVGVIATLAKRIAEHLEGLPQAVAKVSTRKLKVDMGVTAVAPETWRLAVHRYQEDGPEWLLRRCSLVRASAVSAKELGHPLGHRIDLCQPGTTKAPAKARASLRGDAASTRPAMQRAPARPGRCDGPRATLRARAPIPSLRLAPHDCNPFGD